MYTNRAPEVIMRASYGTAVDVWSIGCILFELATGDQLFTPKAGTTHSKDDDHLGTNCIYIMCIVVCNVCVVCSVQCSIMCAVVLCVL